LVLIGFACSVLLGFGLGLLTGVLRTNLDEPIWVMVIYIALFGLLCLWLLRRYQQEGIDWRFVWGQRPERPRWFVLGGLILAALVFSLSSFVVVAGVLSYRSPLFVEGVLQQVNAEANPHTQHVLLYQMLTAIATIIVAPITEEFIFRGFILQRWAVKWNLPLALILSSMVFGLLHLNPIGLSVFGLLMGVLYIKTRSLLVPITGHMLNNIIATGMTYLPQDPNPTDVSTLRESLPAAIILLVFSAPWLVWFMAKNFPRRDAPIPYVINAQKSVTDA
jgi:membrane protease YdiL (CAAX protease family)